MPQPEAEKILEKPEALGGNVEWTSAKARTDGDFHGNVCHRHGAPVTHRGAGTSLGRPTPVS